MSAGIPSGNLAPPKSRDRTAWACAGIFLATLAAYGPALRGGFIWDDDAYVTRPELRSVRGLELIWFRVGATEQYYPVLHSAFWVEHRLWGDSPAGYHLINVFFHASAACLFALILLRLGKGEEVAWLAAFLFALHPVCAESVAWISEQKNTLSTVFYLLSALTFLHWQESRAARSRLYFLALGLFVLALLSKTVTATLPAALLVVAWWRRGSLSWKRDALPLLPWFALGAAGGIFSGWVERAYLGAQGADFSLSFVQRCLVAGRAFWFYLGKLVWPANLIFIYPRWSVDAGAGGQILFPLAAVAAMAALWLLRRRVRAPAAALFFFAGTLFPTLGFLNVYAFIFSYVADHWQYLASLGIIALAAAGWARWARASIAVAAAVLCLLGGLTWRQCRLYRDPQVLYQATLQRNPGAWLADTCLGVILADNGRVPEAIADYQQALRLEPDYALGHFDLGNALVQAGRLAEAVGQFSEALRLDPGLAQAHLNLGNILLETGNNPDAIAHYKMAAGLQPGSSEIEVNLGRALARAGRFPEAVAAYESALRLDPGYADAHFALGNALANLGRMSDAASHFEEASRLRPDYPEARNNLGAAFMRLGRFSEAIDAYESALRLRTDYPQAEYNLGLALRAVGRMDEAAAHFERARMLRANSPR
jgi:protein O-mannosyl-transferase